MSFNNLTLVALTSIPYWYGVGEVKYCFYEKRHSKYSLQQYYLWRPDTLEWERIVLTEDQLTEKIEPFYSHYILHIKYPEIREIIYTNSYKEQDYSNVDGNDRNKVANIIKEYVEKYKAMQNNELKIAINSLPIKLFEQSTDVTTDLTNVNLINDLTEISSRKFNSWWLFTECYFNNPLYTMNMH